MGQGAKRPVGRWSSVVGGRPRPASGRADMQQSSNRTRPVITSTLLGRSSLFHGSGVLEIEEFSTAGFDMWPGGLDVDSRRAGRTTDSTQSFVSRYVTVRVAVFHSMSSRLSRAGIHLTVRGVSSGWPSSTSMAVAVPSARGVGDLLGGDPEAVDLSLGACGHSRG